MSDTQSLARPELSHEIASTVYKPAKGEKWFLYIWMKEQPEWNEQLGCISHVSELREVAGESITVTFKDNYNKVISARWGFDSIKKAFLVKNTGKCQTPNGEIIKTWDGV